jgi:hypothetical protein
MKTKWVIQKNLCTDNFDSIVRALKNLKLPYDAIDVIPFSETLDYDANYDGPIVAYGSTSLMKLAPKSWIPGVWYNEATFKPSNWGPCNMSRYLNSNYIIMPLRDVLKHWRDDKQFIRPNSDFKLFSGDVFMKGDFKDWYEKVKKLIDTGTYVNLTLDTSVSVAPYQYIDNEWRFFIADKIILAASQYKVNGHVKPSTDMNGMAYNLARDIARSKWQLASAYVVDIAEVYSQFKIIEFNNFNSSGFYKCNIESIIDGASRLAVKEWNNVKR